MIEDHDRFNQEMERLGALEEGFRGIRDDMGEIKKALVSFMRETRDTINGLTDRIAMGQKTQWPIIFGSVGIAVTIIGFLATGYVRDLSRVEDKQRVLYERGYDVQYDRGRVSVMTELLTVSQKEVFALKERVGKLEVRASRTEQDIERSVNSRLLEIQRTQRLETLVEKAQ